VSALMQQAFAGDSGKTVEQHVKESIGTIGENIVPARLVAFQAENGVDRFLCAYGRQAGRAR
jgi:translation elongation factor EF-Ts